MISLPNRMAISRLVSMLTVFAVCAATSFAAPNVSGLYPPGVQRGQEVRVTFGGSQLTDPQDIVFYEPGIELVELEAQADNRITGLLRIADDCPLGQIPFRVCTARGVSNLKQIGITALPCVDEVEPAKGSDQSIGADVPKVATIRGTLVAEDEDAFCVELSAGESLSFEIEALRHGRTEIDPEMVIADPSGKIVYECDDTTLTMHDPCGTFVATAAGKHTIRVREARRIGNGGYQYLLHLGKFPRPLFGMPGGGRPGEEVNVTWFEEGREPWQEKIKLPKDATKVHEVYAKNADGIAPTANEFRICDLKTISEVEPNDSIKAPQKIEVPCAIAAALHEPGNSDNFQFTAKKGQRFEMNVYGRRSLRSPIDASIRVRKVGGGQIVSAADSGGPDCFVDFTAPEDGDYVILISDHLKRGGPNYAYRLEIAPIERTLTLGSPERVYRVDPTVNLPRGNRMAVLINAGRRHFNEDVTLDWGQLPKGVTVDSPIIPKGQDRVSVVFNVAADAQRGGHLLPVIGRAKVGEEAVVGKYNQRTCLVRGRNNIDVWGCDLDRLATAVTDESPYTIEVVVPPVPLVRNGSLPLLVTAKRREGFKGAIKLNLLHPSAGVAGRRDVMMPEGQDTQELLLTANGGAAIGNFPIVVLAEANVDGVDYITSSRLVELRVEDRFFDVAFEKASVELGKQCEMIVKVTKKRDYEGKLMAELVGLPSGTSSVVKEVPADAEQISFPITATEKARPGRFNTVICQLKVLPKPDAKASESILHILGTGQLRVDKPLPPPQPKTPEAPKAPAETQASAK